MTIRDDIAKSITTKAFLKKLESVVDDLGGVTVAANSLGVPYQRISNTIHGKELPSKAILKAMGYRSVKTISYRYEEL